MRKRCISAVSIHVCGQSIDWRPFYLGKSLYLWVWNWMKIASEINYHLLSLREGLSKYSHPTPHCFLCSKHSLCTESNVHGKMCKTNLSKRWIILKQFREGLSVFWCIRWLRKVLFCCTEGTGNVLTLSINCFNIIHSLHCDWISDLYNDITLKYFVYSFMVQQNSTIFRESVASVMYYTLVRFRYWCIDSLEVKEFHQNI